MQRFLANVKIKLSSLENTLLHRDPGDAGLNKFFDRPSTKQKPRVHLDVWPMVDENSQQSSLMGYLNFSYADAFRGRFSIGMGDMSFTLMDALNRSLGVVQLYNVQ
jgi:hypothetical protein